MPHDAAHCKNCRTAKPRPGHTTCEPCAAARRAKEAAMRAERRTDARCVTCGRKAAKNRRYCRTHLDYYAERAAAKA